jgi:hypothetical protein
MRVSRKRKPWKRSLLIHSGVVSHYAMAKLHEILDTLNASSVSSTTVSGGVGSVKGVTTASVLYVGKEGILVEQWKALLLLLNKGGKGDVYAQKLASLCLAKLLIPACPSQRFKNTNTANASLTTTSTGTSTSEVLKQCPIQFASAVEPLEAIAAWVVLQVGGDAKSAGQWHWTEILGIGPLGV